MSFSPIGRVGKLYGRTFWSYSRNTGGPKQGGEESATHHTGSDYGACTQCQALFWDYGTTEDKFIICPHRPPVK